MSCPFNSIWIIPPSSESGSNSTACDGKAQSRCNRADEGLNRDTKTSTRIDRFRECLPTANVRDGNRHMDGRLRLLIVVSAGSSQLGIFIPFIVELNVRSRSSSAKLDLMCSNLDASGRKILW